MRMNTMNVYGIPGIPKKIINERLLPKMEMPELSRILAAMEKVSGMKYPMFLTNDRHKIYTIPRHVAMYFIKENTKLTLHEIGRVFNRDHSTVIYAMKRAMTLNDPQYNYFRNEMLKILNYASN